jgi:hypothetical protein
MYSVGWTRSAALLVSIDLNCPPQTDSLLDNGYHPAKPTLLKNMKHGQSKSKRQRGALHDITSPLSLAADVNNNNLGELG